MKSSQRLWRSLFFILLISALCGGLAMPLLAPASAAPQMQTATNVVISEFRTGGPGGGNDEFVELYNPTTLPVDISGWLIIGSNNNGTTNTRYTFPSATILQAGQHYLIVGGGYSGTVLGEPGAVLSSGIPDNGGIALTLADTTIIDQVGMSAGSAYGEGNRLTPLTTNTDQGYERRPGGAADSCQETNDNSADFQVVTPSLPQNSSSPLSLCGVVLPTSTPTSSPTSTATPTRTGSATITSPPAATTIVISEFRTKGPNGANDEFVELFNPTGVSIDISNWEIWGSNGDNPPITSLLETILAGTTLAPGQHYLVANSGYNNSSVPADQTYGTGITDNGGIALTLPGGSPIVDQVGMSNNSAYGEGARLFPIILTNQSYDRKASPSGSCIDTNNNLADFFSRVPSDPQNRNSPRGRCGNPTPTPTATRPRTATPRATPTRTLSPPPPPPLVAINEFVPRPGHDWNNDGVVNVEDEYIELINHGTIDVNLSGYSLDDEVNIGSNPYQLPAITISPGERIVFYGSETGLLLSDGGDGVRLLKPNGQLADAYNYTVVRFPDQSYCRLPDNGGLDDWNTNCFPTPGLQNALSGSLVSPPNVTDIDLLCPIADTLPLDFILAECPPFGNNIWRAAYWDDEGWYGEKYLPRSPGKWPVFAD